VRVYVSVCEREGEETEKERACTRVRRRVNETANVRADATW